MRRIVRTLVPLVVIAWAAAATAADIHVKFHAIKNRADIEAAKIILKKNLFPESYDTRIYDSKRWAPRRRSSSLEIYVRDWVQLGKGDINADGVEDWFYFFDDRCGSIGCSLWIVDGRPGAHEFLCRTEAGSAEDVRITDRVTVSGFHELETPGLTYWHGNECIFDDDQMQGQLPLPDPLRP